MGKKEHAALITKAFIQYFDLRPDVEYIGAVEANDMLRQRGILNDRELRKGAPLRIYLRDGLIPNAKKIAGNWRIYNPIKHELNTCSTKQQSYSTITEDGMSDDNAMPYCFEPIVDELSEILVLGTMPGEESLSTGEYYAKSGNIFWQILSRIFNKSVPFTSYFEKLECLHRNRIALWDVLEYCERKGSTDKSIAKEVINDIEHFLKEHPSIKRIVFNGKSPQKYYKPSIVSKVALSTSPSNRRYSDKRRTESWIEALGISIS